MEQLTPNQINPRFSNLKNDTRFKLILPVMLFFILNTLKITIYNLYIIPFNGTSTFIYKFAITAMLAAIVYPIAFRFKSFMPLLLFYILQVVYIAVNISYYLYYHNYLHIMQMVTLFKEAFISAGHSSTPMSVKLLIAFIDLPFFLYIVFKYSNIKQLFSSLPTKGLALIMSSIVMIMCIEGVNFAQGNSIIQHAGSKAGDESPIVERYGTLVNNIYCLVGNRGYTELNTNLSLSKTVSSNTESKKRPNFVILQIESMDSNIINTMYKDQYVTPFLHSLTEKSVYYPYVLSYHMGGGTSDTEFSVINSVEPIGYYPSIKIEGFNYSNSLIRHLSKNRYYAAAFHGNSGEFYDRNIAFPNMGFNDFLDLKKMNMTDNGWGAPDNQVFDYAENYFKKINQPFISYIISMTSHTPFINAQNYYNNSLYDSIEDETVKNYFNSLSYVDRSIEDFVSKIREEHKDTYIFILGDHTPCIENEWYKQASFIMDNKYFEFVPLLIITPDNKVYKENKSVASFLDISPTILDASGIKYSIKSNGTNLINHGINKDDNSIPFKGSFYDRKQLFEKITSQSN